MVVDVVIIIESNQLSSVTSARGTCEPHPPTKNKKRRRRLSHDRSELCKMAVGRFLCVLLLCTLQLVRVSLRNCANTHLRTCYCFVRDTCMVTFVNTLTNLSLNKFILSRANPTTPSTAIMTARKKVGHYLIPQFPVCSDRCSPCLV